MQRKIFAPRFDGVKMEWKNYLMMCLMYFAKPDIFQVIKSKKCKGRSIWRYGCEERPIHSFGGKTEGNRRIGIPKPRWQNCNTTDLQQVYCGDMNWFGLVQGRDIWRALVNTVMNIRIP
jgi:hypothetical protein